MSQLRLAGSESAVDARLGGLRTADLMGKADRENFPVASWFLPRATRRHLLAIYGFARLADDLGDEAAGDRLRHLDQLQSELEQAFAGTARHPILARLSATIRECRLPREPFLALIAANRMDQGVHRYATFADLRAYCRLSAEPVGRLVLMVTGTITPARAAWSDDVCTGLQLAEHWQDVAEDAARDRIYLPGEDLARFGVEEAQILRGETSPDFLRLMAFEVERARGLLAAGAPLTGSLRGRLRLAIAGFAGGGSAALDAIEAAGYDVVRHRTRPSKRHMIMRSLGILAEARGRGAGEATRWTPRKRSSSANGSPDSRPETSPTASACCRSRSVRRSRPSTPSLAGSTTSETARSLHRPSSRNWNASVSRSGRCPSRPTAAIRVATRSCALSARSPARYPLPLGAFEELIDGCEMDCTRTTIQTYDELVHYCRLVAGSIGRLSVSIFGVPDMAVAAPLADALGIALQITNILRDIVEDREEMGRVYIPREDIVGFGCRDDLTGDRDRLALLVSYEARRARSWYDQGLTLLPLLDQRSRACVATMAGIYRRLLERIEAEPELPLEGRVSLSGWEKAQLASRALVGLPT